MEKKITFRSSGLSLEGLFDLKSKEKGVVVLHPHPLYGGDMVNPVVETVIAAYSRRGWSTLRFNFRGVGGSDGGYDNGKGERDDVLASISCMTAQGIHAIHLVGYSFGSWVQAQLPQLPGEVVSQVMVSPPIALLPLPKSLKVPGLKLVLTGEHDDIAPVQQVEAAVSEWNPKARFHVVDGADHFYFGRFNELESLIVRELKL